MRTRLRQGIGVPRAIDCPGRAFSSARLERLNAIPPDQGQKMSAAEELNLTRFIAGFPQICTAAAYLYRRKIDAGCSPLSGTHVTRFTESSPAGACIARVGKLEVEKRSQPRDSLCRYRPTRNVWHSPRKLFKPSTTSTEFIRGIVQPTPRENSSRAILPRHRKPHSSPWRRIS